MINTTAEPRGSNLAGVEWLDRGLEWIKNQEGTILVAGIGFQLIVLIGMIVAPLTTLLTGDTILLRVVPVDPRDLFRADAIPAPPAHVAHFRARLDYARHGRQ
jgi:hypothetical protein